MGILSNRLNRYYRSMQRKSPDVLWFGDGTRREIALTFDDGPHPRDTPRVLEALAKHESRATFFLVGKGIEQHASLVKQVHLRGHQVALHCYHHLPFFLEKPHSLRAQLDRTRIAIADACGIPPEKIRDVRPPYGAFTARTASLLREWGYRLVMWSSIPQHWMQPLNWSVAQVLEDACPGAVIVLHDGHGHGEKVTEIVEAVIPPLKAAGYEFITIDQMRNSSTDEAIHPAIPQRE
jgi:peptidoglycan/xylan/chitin deacetylase (PgdA/CDA1 family)